MGLDLFHLLSWSVLRVLHLHSTHKYIFHIHLSYVDTNWKNIYISHEQDSYQILIKISDIAIENKVQFLVFKPLLMISNIFMIVIIRGLWTKNWISFAIFHDNVKMLSHFW